MCWKTPEADIPLHSEPRPEGLGMLEVIWRRPWTSIYKINTHWLKISKTVPFLKNPTAEHITLKEFFSLTQRSGRIPNIIHGGKSSLGRRAIESASSFYISAVCGSEGEIDPKQKLTSLRQLWYIVLFFTHASLFQDFAVMSCRMLWHWFYRGCHCHHYVL